jgi:hypothetical protein
MININVKIDGLDKLNRALIRAPAEVINQMSTAVKKSVLIIQNVAMREAPVNKQTGGGTLRQNIKGRMITKLSGVVESLAPYSIFVHEGTRPHDIRPIKARGLANKRTGEYFGKLVHHPGTRANPYFARAAEKAQGKINEYFSAGMKKIVDLFR